MKSKSQIENWALLAVTARTIDGGTRPEDSLVEFKREWPSDSNKAARQIAAICNSARGDDVLWVIGFDEIDGCVGCESKDFQDWWPRIQSQFIEISPNLVEVVFHFEDAILVALVFEADRAPYLVKNPQFGKERGVVISSEVPYRNNAKTSTATRSQLASILGPRMVKPEVEILGLRGELTDYQTISNPFSVSLHTYITPRTETLVFPFHRASARLISVSGEIRTSLKLRIIAGDKRGKYDNAYVVQTPYEIVLKHPARILFEIRDESMKDKIPDWVRNDSFKLQIILKAVEYDLPIVLECQMQPSPDLLHHLRSKNRTELTQVWRLAEG